MNNLAIKAEGLSKKYKLGALGSQHDSLRDALKSLFSRRQAKKTGEFWALKNASFEIGRGENVGIIGLNGAGKSTLLKILSQIVTPTLGTAQITGRLGALLEVGTGFHRELTGRENVFLYGSILGMNREEVAKKFDAIVEFSEIGKFIDTPVKRYSSGMYVRLAFSVAAHLDPDILLLDEVLAVGDFSFQKKCMDFAKRLQQRGSTIVVVSHNMASIKTMCSRVIYLRKGEVVFDGPTEEGMGLYEADGRLSEGSWFKGEEEPPLVFTDMKVFNERGQETAVFDHGERMTIRMRYKTRRPVDGPSFGVSINKIDDVHCTCFTSIDDKLVIDRLDGEGVIELITPPIKLIAEHYFFSLTMRERGHGDLVVGQMGSTFHVRHPIFLSYPAYGIFREPGQWRHLADTARTLESSDAVG